MSAPIAGSTTRAAYAVPVPLTRPVGKLTSVLR
jgi:hypothetical protein